MNTPRTDPGAAQYAARVSTLVAIGGLFLFSPLIRLPGGSVLLGLLGCVGFGAGVLALVRQRAGGKGVIRFAAWGMFLSVVLIGNVILAVLGLLRF